ncbi:MAG: hypothetical protein BMS9Abin33_0678 [Gammaproteobacteria bacterium]|nr:MAG: hypothetical protein BMS9Abin33_0678 [Gammaproteobacteria bacterium]
MTRMFPVIIILITMWSGIVVAHGPGTPTTDATSTVRVSPETSVRMNMVVAGSIIKLFVTDQSDQPVDVSSASATAFISAKESSLTLQLLPAAHNELSGEAVFAADPDMKVHVSLRMPGHAAVSKSFTPLKNNK